MEFDKVKSGVAAKEFVLIDVRGKGEWDSGHIPGANLLPLPDVSAALGMSGADFESRFGFSKPAKDTAVVLHCKKGGRAAQAAANFTGAGFTNTQVYGGSWDDWVAKGGDVEK